MIGYFCIIRLAGQYFMRRFFFLFKIRATFLSYLNQNLRSGSTFSNSDKICENLSFVACRVGKIFPPIMEKTGLKLVKHCPVKNTKIRIYRILYMFFKHINRFYNFAYLKQRDKRLCKAGG